MKLNVIPGYSNGKYVFHRAIFSFTTYHEGMWLV